MTGSGADHCFIHRYEPVRKESLEAMWWTRWQHHFDNVCRIISMTALDPPRVERRGVFPLFRECFVRAIADALIRQAGVTRRESGFMFSLLPVKD